MKKDPTYNAVSRLSFRLSLKLLAKDGLAKQNSPFDYRRLTKYMFLPRPKTACFKYSDLIKQ